MPLSEYNWLGMPLRDINRRKAAINALAVRDDPDDNKCRQVVRIDGRGLDGFRSCLLYTSGLY